VTHAATVTAGLKWPPETWPTADTMVAMARPWARATATRDPPSMLPWVTMIEPAPMKIRVNVPTTSAVSRWVMGRSMLPPPRY
jgi:hypothetical protein